MKILFYDINAIQLLNIDATIITEIFIRWIYEHWVWIFVKFDWDQKL